MECGTSAYLMNWAAKLLSKFGHYLPKSQISQKWDEIEDSKSVYGVIRK